MYVGLNSLIVLLLFQLLHFPDDAVCFRERLSNSHIQAQLNRLKVVFISHCLAFVEVIVYPGLIEKHNAFQNNFFLFSHI